MGTEAIRIGDFRFWNLILSLTFVNSAFSLIVNV